MTPEDKELCANLRRPIDGALETIATAAHINSERATAAYAIERLSAELSEEREGRNGDNKVITSLMEELATIDAVMKGEK